MATNPKDATVTLDDFIAASEASEERLEFVDGQIVAMSGASLDHGVITQNIAREVGVQTRGRCRVVSQGTLVSARIGDDAYIPDVAVVCGMAERHRLRGLDVVLNPVIIVEVLSPSTSNFDHVTKWENYRRIPSLQEYLLVSQDRALVERYTRHGEHFWLFSEIEGLNAEVRFEGLNVTLSLAEIYADVVFGGESDGEEPAG